MNQGGGNRTVSLRREPFRSGASSFSPNSLDVKYRSFRSRSHSGDLFR